MLEKKDLILEAAIEVFSEKGYTLSTTMEISKKAGVSEMTLFRHFHTKHNLFLETIRLVVGESLSIEDALDFNQTLRGFLLLLLHEKLTVISKHTKIIKMLIRENLAHTIPQELEFIKIMYNQIIRKISSYVQYHALKVDAISFAELIVGLLLRYTIMEQNPTYHSLPNNEQKIYISKYLNILQIELEK